MVIGHEFIGTVEDISEEDSYKYGISTGDKVIAYIGLACGKCEFCKSGDEANCPDLSLTYTENPDIPPHFWGGYGEYNYSPVSNLVKLPLSLDPRVTCVFACAGPTVLHAFKLAARANFNVKNSKSAVIQGFGPVGAFAVFYLSLLGIRNITVISRRSGTKLKSLAQSLGASRYVSLEEVPGDKLSEHITSQNGGGVDIVLEASGNPAAFPVGLQLLRNRGLYLVPGQYSNSGGVTVDPQLITFKALQVIAPRSIRCPTSGVSEPLRHTSSITR